MKNSVRAGQTFMPDYLASVVVFGIILTVFLSSWNSVIQDQVEHRMEDEMRLRARHTTTFLVSTPGYPEDWNSSNVQIPGFTRPDHVLQGEKIEEFRELSYERQRELLKAGNFYMAIRNDTGILELNGEPLEFGRNYSGAETVVPVTRTVRLDASGKIINAQLFYVVWR